MTPVSAERITSAVFVDDSSVDALHKRVRGGLPVGYSLDHVAIAPAVCRGNVVAQADVAALERCFQLGQPVNDVAIQVEDPPVVLPQLLDALLRDIAPADRTLQDACRYPLRVIHIALLARHCRMKYGFTSF